MTNATPDTLTAEVQLELDLGDAPPEKCNSITGYEEIIYLRAKVIRLEKELEVERQKKPRTEV
jgi:hypothetical protein